MDIQDMLGKRTWSGVQFPRLYATGEGLKPGAPYSLVDVGQGRFYVLPAGVGAVDQALHQRLVEAASAALSSVDEEA